MLFNMRNFTCMTKHTPLNSPSALTNGSSDKRGSISYVVKTFLFNELSNRLGETLVMSLHVVLQDQTTQRTSWFICSDKWFELKFCNTVPIMFYIREDWGKKGRNQKDDQRSQKIRVTTKCSFELKNLHCSPTF